MNVQSRNVNTYSLHRDDPQDLAALLATALADGVPVVVVATDETTGGMARRAGYVTRTTADRVFIDTGMGNTFACCRWELDRAALVEEGWETA